MSKRLPNQPPQSIDPQLALWQPSLPASSEAIGREIYLSIPPASDTDPKPDRQEVTLSLTPEQEEEFDRLDRQGIRNGTMISALAGITEVSNSAPGGRGRALGHISQAAIDRAMNAARGASSSEGKGTLAKRQARRWTPPKKNTWRARAAADQAPPHERYDPTR